jgi:hypothetical protein
MLLSFNCFLIFNLIQIKSSANLSIGVSSVLRRPPFDNYSLMDRTGKKPWAKIRRFTPKTLGKKQEDSPGCYY